MPVDPITLNMFASLNDKGIRHLAKEKTLEDVQDKKHKRINRALFLSMPVAGALAGAAAGSVIRIPNANSAPVITRLSRARRLISAGRGFGSWFVPLTVGWAAFKTLNIAEKNSSSLRNFDNKHPMLTNIGTLALALTGMKGVRKLSTAINNKYASAFMNKFRPQIKTVVKGLESNKFLNYLSKNVKKLPKEVKGATRFALGVAPLVLLIEYFVHSFSHSAKMAVQYDRNYYGLKEAQAQVREKLDASQEAEEV